MRILFVEPFYGGSHRAFLDGLVAHSRHEVVPLVLPAGEWRRRMRGAAQALAPAALALEGEFDAMVASDMLDLATFLALTRRRFGPVPAMVYFHENQFTYPRLRGTSFNSWYGQLNYLSALAADAVAFNSAFHRDDFFRALRALAEQPNAWLSPGGIAAIANRSSVLPVGVDLRWADSPAPGGSEPGAVPLVLWNHRWEFDKGPELFVRTVRCLAAEELPFRLAVAGERGLTPVPAMEELPSLLGERLVHFGHVADRDTYLGLLRAADILVSTTRHEFFGVGMVEGLAAGCMPIAPARYNYPGLVPRSLHERCLWETEADLVAKLRAAITGPRPDPAPLRESAMRFRWEGVAPAWDAALGALASHC